MEASFIPELDFLWARPSLEEEEEDSHLSLFSPFLRGTSPVFLWLTIGRWSDARLWRSPAIRSFSFCSLLRPSEKYKNRWRPIFEKMTDTYCYSNQAFMPRMMVLLFLFAFRTPLKINRLSVGLELICIFMALLFGLKIASSGLVLHFGFL